MIVIGVVGGTLLLRVPQHWFCVFLSFCREPCHAKALCVHEHGSICACRLPCGVCVAARLYCMFGASPPAAPIQAVTPRARSPPGSLSLVGAQMAERDGRAPIVPAPL